MTPTQKQEGGLVGKIDRMAHDTIDGWTATIHVIWQQMCAHEHLDPAASLIAFSQDNPYQIYYNRAVQSLCESIADRQALGYVGLEMPTGKGEMPQRKKSRKKAFGGG